MYCKYCGTELVNGACPNCVTEEAQASYEPEVTEAEAKPKKKGFALAIVSMAAGIASIIWGLGIFGAIAAFVTGAIYKKKNGESHTMVKVGTACGILGIICQVIAFALLITFYFIYYIVILFLIGNM